MKIYLVLFSLVSLSFAAHADWSFLTSNSTDLLARQRADVKAMSLSQIKEANDQLLTNLENAPPSQFPQSAPFVTFLEAQQSLASLMYNPVSSPNSMLRYDPANQIGFCFGRATSVHLDSLVRGLAPDSLLKLWAVGYLVPPEKIGLSDLETVGIANQYHVTILQRTVYWTGSSWAQNWLAIDPIPGQVLTARQWAAEIKRRDKKGNLRLYVTNPKRLLPDGDSIYSQMDFSNPQFNNYFIDLLTDLRMTSSRSLRMFGPLQATPAGAQIPSPVDPLHLPPAF